MARIRVEQLHIALGQVSVCERAGEPTTPKIVLRNGSRPHGPRHATTWTRTTPNRIAPTVSC